MLLSLSLLPLSFLLIFTYCHSFVHIVIESLFFIHYFICVMHGLIRSKRWFLDVVYNRRMSRLKEATWQSNLKPSLECLGINCMVNSGYCLYQFWSFFLWLLVSSKSDNQVLGAKKLICCDKATPEIQEFGGGNPMCWK